MEPETETITVEPVVIELIGLAYRGIKGECEVGFFETPQEAFLEALEHHCSKRLELAR